MRGRSDNFLNCVLKICFHFQNLKNSVETKILDRDFDYYEQKHVEDVEALGNGKF